ncbi:MULTISPECIES: DUF4189 domain-containing protein [unclassified Acinetobacter]|uniref:DUF4189 domain-containing protein n=1 Tax=unclassified Acinetobacter TaxID=196816 RepID=UPI00148F6E9D|nr:DUF4189 domain-containing protein [Acinetobacter sp. Ac_5812]NNP70878.1 hypothetical protein [Acinetobacter sp. Ac_5812]
MKANYGLFIGLVFAGLTPFSVAQVPIAPGVYACDGAAQAGPCNGGNASGGSSSSPYGVVGYAHAAPKWADRWGAFAGDGSIAGIVTGLSSKAQARDKAILQCKERGGGNCKIITIFHNQCLAIATGQTGSNFNKAPSEVLAVKDVISSCEKNGGSCNVYYSGCSLPEQIQ